MAAPELTHLDTSVVCVCLIKKCNKIIEIRTYLTPRFVVYMYKSHAVMNVMV